MTKQNLYIDLNVIQTVPSSNINRDDTGAPKTAVYGGVTRSRVSSQSWKRAVRKGFENDGIKNGSRTTDAVQLLSQKLRDLDSSLDEEAATEKAVEVFKTVKIGLDKDNNTKALLFVSPGQIEKIAQYVLDNEELDSKELKKAFNADHSLDLALFGRMVADSPELNVEGSAQVAHAISTHEIVPEFDYYTAVDDEQPDDQTGSSMIGTIEFNSATLYRYANLNVNELIHNLGDQDAIKGAVAFIKEFILTMPTGKQNTFANKTLPNYVMVTIRQDTPVNLASAFENPVKAGEGYTSTSIKRLNKGYEAAEKFVEAPVFNIVLSANDEDLDDQKLGEQATSFTDLLNQVSDALTKAVQDENTND
ncbi:type I-E CRISPR-associated protein Cas7/Cse4/CasC [Levilactobacillus bambusae]|uniref:Type I-E CRISPR-associated protein Cas7/Cse4/CasC n=1 Tax=Levilactobacillus bambusae TaxID=2024736 RepID=A0A2V1N0E1_9LACO|nr:type I-E CRISPR-associated protein Cas7/Cse4/CasC [Levilactobacillus bambusae]PWG00483.1 type I-E CRISPR-associated protein Cas7/Cse4/CasC [Levilactobacillus bambusae]